MRISIHEVPYRDFKEYYDRLKESKTPEEFSKTFQMGCVTLTNGWVQRYNSLPQQFSG